MIECLFNIGVEHEHRLAFNRHYNGGYGIMGAEPRTKAVTMRFKSRLPFWFERELHQRLLAAVDHRQDGERTPFCCPWLGDPHPSYRHGRLVVPVSGVNRGSHRQPLFQAERFDAIDSS